jgi:aspartate racemase
MIEGLRTLVRAGVECIAIPCNTAHHWYDDLARESSVPVLHMVDAAGAAMQRLGVPDGPVGLLATAGTLAASIYPTRLVRHGYECVVPDDGDMETLVTPGIGLVKAGRTAEAEELLRTAADNLLGRGARVVILACTEIPVALKDDDASEGRYVDATRALAEACVRWFRGNDRPPPGAREKRQRQNA